PSPSRRGGSKTGVVLSERRKNVSRHAATISAASKTSCHARCLLAGNQRITRSLGDERRGALQHRDDLGLLLRRDPGPQRQAEILARRLLGLREVSLAVPEIGERRL